MSADSTGKLYSIAMVSKLSGVSCHALRAWERRFGFPVPERSEHGHRRYAQAQVEAIRGILIASRSGRPLAELIAEHCAGRLGPTPEAGSTAEARPAWSAVVDSLLAGDFTAADARFDRLTRDASFFEVIVNMIEPALVEIGERWYRGEVGLFQESGASDRLLARLQWMLEMARRANSDPRWSVVVGTIEGERHRGGVLMIALALELVGCRTITLGSDLPVEEYRAAVESWRPDAVAVSFVQSRGLHKRFEELSAIRSIPVFVGGRSLLNHQGLARSVGLIPLVGPLKITSTSLVNELERRKYPRG